MHFSVLVCCTGLVHSNIRLQGILGLHETLRTGGVRARELGRIHAMGLSVRSLRDPELTPRGQSSIVSNECAGTTDREQCGGMNVSLLGADGASRVVRIMVFSIDIKHLISCPVGGGVCDTGL